MFFIHEHFDVYTIAQLNFLVDTYMAILHSKEFKENPMLSQFNTIKYALLIYRISWKIDSSHTTTLNFKGYKGEMIPSNITGSKRLKYDRDQPYTKEITYYNYYQPGLNIHSNCLLFL